jgi:hypothetical protein
VLHKIEVTPGAERSPSSVDKLIYTRGHDAEQSSRQRGFVRKLHRALYVQQVTRTELNNICGVRRMMKSLSHDPQLAPAVYHEIGESAYRISVTVTDSSGGGGDCPGLERSALIVNY